MQITTDVGPAVQHSSPRLIACTIETVVIFVLSGHKTKRNQVAKQNEVFQKSPVMKGRSVTLLTGAGAHQLAAPAPATIMVVVVVAVVVMAVVVMAAPAATAAVIMVAAVAAAVTAVVVVVVMGAPATTAPGGCVCAGGKELWACHWNLTESLRGTLPGHIMCLNQIMMGLS